MKFNSSFNIQCEKPDLALAQFEDFIQNDSYNIIDMDEAICYTSYYGSLDLFEKLAAFENQYLMDNNINKDQYRNIFTINNNEPIHNAVGRKNLPLVKYLIHHGVDVVTPSDVHLGSYPGAAASDGDLETLQYLIEDLHLDYHLDHDSAFMIACRNNHKDCITYLYKKGIDIAGLNKALQDCCEYGQLDSIKFLIEHGANPCFDGQLPFKIVCRKGYLECAQYLYSQQAHIATLPITSTHPNIIDFHHGKPQQTTTNAVSNIYTHVINMNEKNSFLGMACFSGNLELIRFLLDNKFSFNHNAQEELSTIVKSDYLPIIKIFDLLISHGIDLSPYNLMEKAIINQDKNMIEYLFQHNVSCKHNIKTIVDYVQEHDDFNTLDYFIHKGLTPTDIEPFITNNIKRYFFHNKLHDYLPKSAQKDKKIKI